MMTKVKSGNWQTKKLGDILCLAYGKLLDDTKRNPNGKYPAYGANGEKNRTDEYYYDQRSIIVGRLIIKKLDDLPAKTKKLESIYQKKLALLDELKKLLLKKAFAGEL